MGLKRDHDLRGSNLETTLFAPVIMALDNNDSNNAALIDNDALISSENALIDVEADLEKLSELATSNPTLLGGEDVAQLLERLSSAESMAEGMESKLDSVLQNLDNLLAILDGTGLQSDNIEEETKESAQKVESNGDQPS